jgi:hypothetical protein
MKEVPAIDFKYCDQSHKGIKCREIIEETCTKFFLLDINEVETALNEKRKFWLSEWASKDFHDKIKYKNEETEYEIEKGMCQLALPFKLNTPKTITVNINKQGKRDAPAEVMFSNGKFDIDNISYKFEKTTLLIYLNLLQYDSDTIVWLGHYPYYLKDIVYHELVHICGDIVCDGVIRHNMVGIDVINELID